MATTKFEYQGISDYGWEVAYVPGGYERERVERDREVERTNEIKRR